jgi:glycosyltransferase involved in cell wall biosynthesis
MILGIDAFNIRAGGGVTHLVELLSAVDPTRNGFSKVIVWAPKRTRERLPERPWLETPVVAALDRSLWHRANWHRRESRQAQIAAECDIVLAPGGIAAGGFSPVVTMSQNLLPFAPREALRYGLSAMTLKLWLIRLAQLRSFRRSQGLLFLSDHAAQTILPLLGRAKSDSAIVPHGVNDIFRMPPRPSEVFTEKRPCRILYVSIVSPYKHHWHVVEAVAELHRQGHPVRLDLIGPSDRGIVRLRAAMTAADPAGCFITWHGAVPYDTLPDHYEQSDIGVFASSCENMPNILLEGMAAGLPMACSDRGPMPEILGDAGVYFDPERPKTIADALVTLLSDGQLRQRMAKAAFARAADFTWARCADDTFDFLARTVRRQKARHDDNL